LVIVKSGVVEGDGKIIASFKFLYFFLLLEMEDNPPTSYV